MKLKYTLLLPQCVEGGEVSRRRGIEAATIFTETKFLTQIYQCLRAWPVHSEAHCTCWGCPESSYTGSKASRRPGGVEESRNRGVEESLMRQIMRPGPDSVEASSLRRGASSSVSSLRRALTSRSRGRGSVL